MKRQSVKFSRLVLGWTFSVIVCSHLFSCAVVPRSDDPQTKRPYTFDTWYSWLISPGSGVDVVCIPTDQESGEKPWVVLPNVRVLVAVHGFNEWSTVTIEMTARQAAELKRAQRQGILRAIPRGDSPPPPVEDEGRPPAPPLNVKWLRLVPDMPADIGRGNENSAPVKAESQQ
jgi:hypothetical protein